ncbi:MAG: hypothetical protein LBB64_03900, partial [Dysgonamonadaceae bacterium]|nr:hypothetical protein [Dysgonamonadaceae bacterium]
MKHSRLINTHEHVNDWIASGFAFAMTGRPFTRLLVNLFTHLRMKHSRLINTHEHVNDWIASGYVFAMTGRPFTRLLVNSFTFLRILILIFSSIFAAAAQSD